MLLLTINSSEQNWESRIYTCRGKNKIGTSLSASLEIIEDRSGESFLTLAFQLELKD
jgi:hypothetical protein